MLSACNHLFYYPDRHLHYPPKHLGLEPEDIFFESTDGTRLHAWWFRPSTTQAAKGTLIQFHGNAQNISSHYLAAIWLVKEGYNVFVFDYRGYGQSEGKPSPKGVHQDSVKALEVAWDLHQQHSPLGAFILLGQSLGGIVSLRAIEDFQNAQEIDLIIIESGFPSYTEVAARVLRQAWLTWPFSPLAYILISDRYAPKQYTQESFSPLIVIHDKRDPIVPYSLGKKLYEKAQGPKEFWEPNQGQHIHAFANRDPTWQEKLLQRLKDL